MGRRKKRGFWCRMMPLKKSSMEIVFLQKEKEERRFLEEEKYGRKRKVPSDL